jgi:DNA-binding GntR family transcriptional regulator
MFLPTKLAPGGILPERRLAEKVGISRTPVREAISRLAVEADYAVRKSLVDCRENVRAEIFTDTSNESSDGKSMKKSQGKAVLGSPKTRPAPELVAGRHRSATQKRGGRTGASDFNASTPSMADRAYLYLTERLSNGELRGGDVIQERRLAAQLKLSRTPIRDALTRLEGEGLLERSGRALVVRRISIKEFLDMLHVRRLIEPEAAFLAAGKMDQSLLLSLKLKLLATEKQTKSDLFALDESIHLNIANSLRNDCLADLVLSLRRRTRLFELTEFPGKNRSDRNEHLKLIDALIASNAQEARNAMLEHLDTLREEVVEQIRNL